ncbi:hypothetical protein K469DRAFT_682150 [Zopfia rhizophila CBS 207.26]|uniref:C2H2-type domain-containing protein n=1 Tax=Zopfia rhizophila CBS 207.26 TaxID=1314779 RepID=A0A6A6EUW3_9PEZI|nr:hypothetical protein K469DRAFT_682150 [Zopfia rhizophila CBS 207.26]
MPYKSKLEKTRIKSRTPRVQRVRGSTVRDPPEAVKREGVELQEAVDPLDKALEAAKVLVYKEKRPTICWIYLGNEGLLIKDRIYSFYTPGDLTKHFNKKHLKKVREGECFKCDLYQVSLNNKEHWQRHGYDVHGIVSQSVATGTWVDLVNTATLDSVRSDYGKDLSLLILERITRNFLGDPPRKTRVLGDQSPKTASYETKVQK